MDYTTNGKAMLIRFIKPINIFDKFSEETMIEAENCMKPIDVVITGDRLEFRWNDRYTINVPLSIVEVIAWKTGELNNS